MERSDNSMELSEDYNPNMDLLPPSTDGHDMDTFAWSPILNQQTDGNEWSIFDNANEVEAELAVDFFNNHTVEELEEIAADNDVSTEIEHLALIEPEQIDDYATVPRVQPNRNTRIERTGKPQIRKTQATGTYAKTAQRSNFPVARTRAQSSNQVVPGTPTRANDSKRVKNNQALRRHRNKKADFLKFAPGEIEYKKALKLRLEVNLYNLDQLIKELHVVPMM